MKKSICVLLVAVLLLSLCACGEIEIPMARKMNTYIMSNFYIDWESFSAEENTEVGSAYKYYFSRLSELQKKAYNNILKEITEAEDTFPEKIEVPLMESDELTQVYEAVAYDNPEIMCFGTGASIITEGDFCFFKPEYTMIPAEMRERTAYLAQLADNICANLPENASSFSKELAIHDYLVKKCYYNNDSDDSTMAYTCVYKGYASCEGYAKATKYFLEKAGINSICVAGEARNLSGESERHMWNIVNIDGRFYHLDTTWDDPVKSGSSVSHIYFNLSDEEIRKDHSDFETTFECNSTAANYFNAKHCVFDDAGYYSRLNMQSEIIRNLEKGERCVQLKFSSKEAFESAVYTLITESLAYEIQTNIKLLRPDLLSSENINYSKYEDFNIIELMF
ncbi:MAG: hypothetical protein MJ120_02770 [Clostridia bacterium]|nr:hypothetical protein [Clostridia bacterium]